MKGYRFYSDFRNTVDKRKNVHRGSVIALLLGTNGRPLWSGSIADCIAGVYDWPDSGVATTGVSGDYLRTRCKRITEAKAREIHPALFIIPGRAMKVVDSAIRPPFTDAQLKAFQLALYQKSKSRGTCLPTSATCTTACSRRTSA